MRTYFSEQPTLAAQSARSDALGAAVHRILAARLPDHTLLPTLASRTADIVPPLNNRQSAKGVVADAAERSALAAEQAAEIEAMREMQLTVAWEVTRESQFAASPRNTGTETATGVTGLRPA
ncbi:hypothetical protein [Nonomuraea sp. NPDC050783]|uniref:hypothetical protein n=1 Tax=Nonomuraea sp. NPDC050783 TaxID=3154634 RepID=UPI00346785B5